MSEVARKRTRTCIGCGTKSDKVELFRIVRTGEGLVSFDATGRLPGRGAYVCSKACFEAASKGKLQRALKCAVGKEDTVRVAEDLDEALAGASAR